MSMQKVHDLVPCIYLLGDRAVTGFGQKNLFGDGDPEELAYDYSVKGADRLLVFDFSGTMGEHDRAMAAMRNICRASQVPVIGAGNIRSMEDIEQLIYNGCDCVALNCQDEQEIGLLSEAMQAYGRRRIMGCVSDFSEYSPYAEEIAHCASGLLVLDDEIRPFAGKTELPILLHSNSIGADGIEAIFRGGLVTGISGEYVSTLGFPEDYINGFSRNSAGDITFGIKRPDGLTTELDDLKMELMRRGIRMDVLESAVPWSEFKKDDRGLVTCVVQDYRNDEVLMVAWMNEESYRKTLETGKMTYWSRSRQELWTKGLTSGHISYVRSLDIDCDKDTILAKVSQIGAACHTGHRSCFFTPLARKTDIEGNPYRVFEKTMSAIAQNGQKPSTDTLIRELGAEHTDMVLASKNKDASVLKREIADYMISLMKIMDKRDITWEDITDEISRRDESADSRA